MFCKAFAAGLVALTLLAGSFGTAEAQSKSIETLSITDPWTRATPPRARTAGGFVTIENTGDTPDRLVAVASPIAGRVEIHEMRMDNGTMIMRPTEGGIEIPAGGKATLAPGGLHIMFMDLKEGFVEGTKVPVTLTFENGGDVEAFFPVEALGASGPTAGAHETHMDSGEMDGSNMHGDGAAGSGMQEHSQ